MNLNIKLLTLDDITVSIENEDTVKSMFVEAGRFATVSRGTRIADAAKLERIGLDCLRKRHMMAFRSDIIKFQVGNISRVASAQLRTHIVGAAQIGASQRYIEIKEGVFQTPPGLTPIDLETFEMGCATAHMMYQGLLSNNVPVEAARYMLPQATCTTVNAAFTPNALFHFFNERLCTETNAELRHVANLLKDRLVQLNPALTEFLVPRCKVYLNICSKSCFGKEANKL